MISFSSDRDILKYEPALFTTNYFPSQVIASGTGATVAGETLTKTGEDFVAKNVQAGNVIHINDAVASINGAYEIISVDSATQLTISVLRMLDNDNAIPVGTGSAGDYRICTYNPQIAEVGYELTGYFGITPGNPSSDYSSDDLLDAEVLRQVSNYGTLAILFASLAVLVPNSSVNWKKSDFYRKRFEATRGRCKVDIDLGDDGVMDLSRFASSPRMLRD